jgi:hypothetical protein
MDGIRVGLSALRRNVFGLNALHECDGKILGVAAKSDARLFERQNRLQVRHKFDSERDTARRQAPRRLIVCERALIGMPKGETIASNGRTARRRGLSELLPTRLP